MKRFHWAPAHEALLREHYPLLRAQTIADALGASVKAVYQKAHALGLKKSAAFHQLELSGRIQRGHTDPRMVASRFKKGLVPWNKGLKGVVGVQEGCRATQFQPGAMPHNTLPVGSYRINPDGHLQQKVSNAKGHNSVRWRGVAELVWCAAHGPLPPGHLVAFKPGQFSNQLENITLDRVECISRAENLRRNSPYRHCAEYGRLVQLKAAIARQVNRIHREHETPKETQA